MQRWEPVDPAELNRRARWTARASQQRRHVDWTVLLAWGGAFLISCAWWALFVVLPAAWSWGWRP